VRFKGEFEFETADHDADLAGVVPNIIIDRFNGTGIVVKNVSITKMEKEEDKP
jgi:hypothetical protein